MTPKPDWAKAYARELTNAELAEILEFSSYYHEAEIGVAAMREAARRLRDDPDLQAASPPPRDFPPLKANAIPD
jgi:hypothetical protein